MTAPLAPTPPAADQNQLARKPVLNNAPLSKTGITIGTFAELWSLATCISNSGFAPTSIKGTEGIVIALQMGFELGLPPMAALQNIAVINGRPSLWGDAQLAVVRATGELEEFSEWFEAGGTKLPRNPITYTDDTVAVCRVKRRGSEPVETGFSVKDAKTAGLWEKAGPWKQYPFRMLRNRARSFALRDTFGDALRGLLSSEEAGDLNQQVTIAPSASAAGLNERMKQQGDAAHQTHQGDETIEGEVDENPKAEPESAAGEEKKPEPPPQTESQPEPRFPTYTMFSEAVKATARERGIDSTIAEDALKKLPINGYDVKSPRPSVGPVQRLLVMEAIEAGAFNWSLARIEN